MKNDTLQIAAVPIGDGQTYDLYCSSCGHLACVPGVYRDQTAMTHLAGHGCHVPALYQINPN